MTLNVGSFSLSLTPYGPWVQIHNNHLTSPWKSKATARFANPLLTGWFPITQFPARNLLSVPTVSPAQQIYNLNKGKHLFVSTGLFFRSTLTIDVSFLNVQLYGSKEHKMNLQRYCLLQQVSYLSFFFIGISHCNFTQPQSTLLLQSSVTILQ